MEPENEYIDIPVYRSDYATALANNELLIYMLSHRANIACRNAIVNAIQRGFDGKQLGNGVEDAVIMEFGLERVVYVLANTVQKRNWDTRFSLVNRAWADGVSVTEDKNSFHRDMRWDYVIGISPAVVDLFVDRIREKALNNVSKEVVL